MYEGSHWTKWDGGSGTGRIKRTVGGMDAEARARWEAGRRRQAIDSPFRTTEKLQNTRWAVNGEDQEAVR